MVLLLLFIMGICIGSFTNVVIDRVATNRSLVVGRSYCESCKKKLSWLELLPLLSFLIQKGKCRKCKASIPFRLFVVELIGGLSLSGLYFFSLMNGLDLKIFLILIPIVFIFISIFFIDLEYGIIPDSLSILLVLLAIGYTLLSRQAIGVHLFAALASFLFFFILFFVTRGKGMGFGDVKLAFVLGLLLGFPLIVVALYVAFLTGAALSIILVMWKKKSFKKSTIPFGPFLVLGAIMALFYGREILSVFTQFL